MDRSFKTLKHSPKTTFAKTYGFKFVAFEKSEPEYLKCPGGGTVRKGKLPPIRVCNNKHYLDCLNTDKRTVGSGRVLHNSRNDLLKRVEHSKKYGKFALEISCLNAAKRISRRTIAAHYLVGIAKKITYIPRWALGKIVSRSVIRKSDDLANRLVGKSTKQQKENNRSASVKEQLKQIKENDKNFPLEEFSEMPYKRRAQQEASPEMPSIRRPNAAGADFSDAIHKQRHVKFNKKDRNFGRFNSLPLFGEALFNGDNRSSMGNLGEAAGNKQSQLLKTFTPGESIISPELLKVLEPHAAKLITGRPTDL